MLGKHKFYITHSLRLCVEHTLLAKDGAELGNIKEVYSHEQAITQCADFLNKAGIKAVACKNTAQAAELVAKSDRSDIAAIGSRDCAKLYGLKMLSADIQNTRNNYTRFICVSKEPEIYPGAKKTGIMLTLPHKPGSLYSIIARFAALGVNLTKLESRPLAGSDFEFLFYFDVEASVYSDELRQLISELENECESFYYLGTYTEA